MPGLGNRITLSATQYQHRASDCVLLLNICNLIRFPMYLLPGSR